MKLKKDWSLAYFLYYMFRIGFWLLILLPFLEILLISYTFADRSFLITKRSIPVVLTIDAFSDYKDFSTGGIIISIPEEVRGSSNIRTDDKSYSWALHYYNTVMIFAGLIIAVIFLFASKILKNVAEGSPFDKRNPRYLFIVGWILLTASILYMSSIYLPMPLLEDIVLTDGIRVKSILINEQNSMIGGFMCLVLGYVFKEGNRIYEEQKLTV